MHCVQVISQQSFCLFVGILNFLPKQEEGPTEIVVLNILITVMHRISVNHGFAPASSQAVMLMFLMIK